MNYNQLFVLTKRTGNNALSHEERERIHSTIPSLIIPSMIQGCLDDVKIGKHIVFEEVENGVLQSCIGLEHFVRISNSPIPTTIFDNHNHALYFWIEALHDGYIKPGFELIHIDEHSDLWENDFYFDLEKARLSLDYVWEFTNNSCNVGNYIQPALKSGLIDQIHRIENDYQVDEYLNFSPKKNTVLNIDLDFFAPEMDFIDEEKKIKLIRKLLKKVNCVTIATSPFFIDQGRAIEKLHLLFGK